MADAQVTRNEAAHRWEAAVDGERAGIVTYRVDGDTITFEHTIVEDAYEGRGIGSALAKAALDGARADGQTVVPQCPFIASYIDKHPEYQGLLA